MSCVVYILQSNKTGKYYIGSSKDPLRRLKEHNRGKNRFTKGQRPWRFVFQEVYPDGLIARGRENQIKAWKSRVAVEKLIKSTNEVLGSPDTTDNVNINKGIGIPISS